MKPNMDVLESSEQDKKNAFLITKIFNGLEDLNSKTKKENLYQFSANDFKVVLERAEYFGLGVYTISSWLKIKGLESRNHDAYNKKATNAKWYKNAFIELTKNEKAQKYSGTFGVSKKLIVDKVSHGQIDETEK